MSFFFVFLLYIIYLHLIKKFIFFVWDWEYRLSNIFYHLSITSIYSICLRFNIKTLTPLTSVRRRSTIIYSVFGKKHVTIDQLVKKGLNNLWLVWRQTYTWRKTGGSCLFSVCRELRDFMHWVWDHTYPSTAHKSTLVDILRVTVWTLLWIAYLFSFFTICVSLIIFFMEDLYSLIKKKDLYRYKNETKNHNLMIVVWTNKDGNCS